MDSSYHASIIAVLVFSGKFDAASRVLDSIFLPTEVEEVVTLLLVMLSPEEMSRLVAVEESIAEKATITPLTNPDSSASGSDDSSPAAPQNTKLDDATPW